MIEILQAIGLTPPEARLYLNALELGPASAIQLAQALGVSRQSIYELIPTLSHKGLLKQVRVGAKNLFEAVSPDALGDRARTVTREIDLLIPQLKARQPSGRAIPSIHVYENPQSMREWYRAMIRSAKSGDEMLIWSSGTLWYRLDQEFYDRFVRDKARKGIIDKVIAPDTPEARIIVGGLKSSTREFRLINTWWNAPSEMWIWKSQIIFLSIRENASNLIVIESEALAALERFKFRQAWNNVA